MLQRAQSIYIIIAAGMLLGFLIFPVAEIININFQIYDFKLAKPVIFKDNSNINLTSMILQISSWFILAITIISFLLYKTRKKQVKLCILIIIFLLVLNVAVFYFLSHFIPGSGYKVYYKLPMLFPVFGAIFLYLAIIGIRKDERLVKSYDRLR